MSAAAVIGAPRQWSHYQLAIFDAIENSSDNIVIEALAGAGKSTSLEEAIMRAPAEASVLVLAFNKSIAEAMRARIPDQAIEIRTAHGFGFSTLREISSSFQMKKWQVGDLASSALGRPNKRGREYVVKLVGLAKGSLTPPDTESLGALADAFELWAPKGQQESRLLGVASAILKQQARQGRRSIDFDDMIWLPIQWGFEIPSYDYVFVDEAQDLNAAQLELALRAAKGGRLIAVGDRHQSIYQFRGADSEAIPKIIAASNARVLPLSITYRCDAAIVREARAFVPALEARPEAPSGVVRSATEDELFEFAAPGDFVLSRTNAPLIKLAYEWLRAGVACEIRGRNIAQDLVNWIETLKARSLAELEMKVHEWLQEQAEAALENPRKVAAAYARAECVIVLAREPGITSVNGITEKIEEMFADSESGDSSRITLASTHRAKGLEADRVWILRDTYRPGESAEESNLLYVALTRAKHELIYVTQGAGINHGHQIR